jgi:subfamily B ATP-binding cassette protein HlyB/CyaB
MALPTTGAGGPSRGQGSSHLADREPLACLRRYPLFNLLTPFQLATWLGAGQELTLATGETIFQEGAAGVWAYLVLKGSVRLVRRSQQGREISLGRIGPGELFGEYALLPPHRNTASCRAASPVRLLSLPLLPLQPVLAAIPGVSPSLKSWLRLHGLLGYLRDQAFLGFMSGPSALTYLDCLRPVSFRALRTIQADGLGNDCWYFIQSGQICLHPAGDAAAVPSRELGPGDCFGELALLGRTGLPIAVTLSTTRCLCLPRDLFARRPDQTKELGEQSLEDCHISTQRKAYAWVGQREAADCGVAALAMVARFHGLEVSVDSLRQRLVVGESGVSLLGLQRAVVGLGLGCLPVRLSGEQLRQVALPAIAHFQGGHYVVLYEFGANGVVIGDPAAGIVRLSQELFAQTCSGNLLLVRALAADRPDHSATPGTVG